MHRTLYTSKTAVLFFLLLFITHFFSSSCLLPVQAEEQNQRIHYLTLPDNTEAILLECNGQFGMVDSGEDNDFPTGEDPRYPLRPGIVQGHGYEDDVIAYLNSVGVTQDNFEFYIGTHPHSDHIGSADEIIRAFHPKRVYIQEYKDTYITYPGNLWDNLYVYDHMLEASAEVGATVIQNFSLDAPLYPEKVLIRGTIEWNDCQNQDNLRPDHITVILSQSDMEVIQELTISPDEDGNWHYEFEQLQKYDNTKTPIIYQVTLESIDGYKTEKADNGYDFLCSHAADEEEADALQRVTETDDTILSDDAKEINDTVDTVPSVDSKKTTETDDIVLPDDSEEVGETDDTISSGNPEETAETDDTVPSEEPTEPDGKYPEGGIFDDVSDSYDNSGSSDHLSTDHITFQDQVDATCLLDPNNEASLQTAEPAQTGLFDDLGSTQDTTSTPVFTLGEDMQIQIKHYGNDYKINPKPDANYFSLGVLVECNGRSAFLAGDINNYEGAETALTEELGHVDILTLGHHGYYGSNTHGYVTGLSPQIMVCAGKCSGISNDPGAAGSYSTLDTLLMMSEKGTPLYATSWYHKSLDALVFNFDEALSSNIPSSVSWLAVTKNLDFNDHIRYLDGFPSAYSGWADYEEKTYYFDNSCYPSRNCWLPLGQKRYYLDNDGTLKIGWLELDEYWYYMDVDGAMLTDWQRINDRLYYFDSHSGTMQTGWLSVDNERYYLNPENGAAKTGWQFVDDEWYYLTPENGFMKTGWQFINNKWYYLNPDNGSMKTGWQFVNNKWYYLTPGNGSMKTGWQFINNKWYYLTPGNGSMKTGWQKINRKYYYLYSSGAMAADTWIGEYYVNRSGIWIP